MSDVSDRLIRPEYCPCNVCHSYQAHLKGRLQALEAEIDELRERCRILAAGAIALARKED